jgi:hypothetical protein
VRLVVYILLRPSLIKSQQIMITFLLNNSCLEQIPHMLAYNQRHVILYDLFYVQILMYTSCQAIKVIKNTDHITFLDFWTSIIHSLLRSVVDSQHCGIQDRIYIVSITGLQGLPLAKAPFGIQLGISRLADLFRQAAYLVRNQRELLERSKSDEYCRDCCDPDCDEFRNVHPDAPRRTAVLRTQSWVRLAFWLNHGNSAL